MTGFSQGDRVFITEDRYGEAVVENRAGDDTVTVQIPELISEKEVCSICERDPHPKVYPEPTSRNLSPGPQFVCIGAGRKTVSTYGPDPLRVNFPVASVVLIEDDEHLAYLYKQRNKALGIA